jgi:predicted glycoside hydrolase/deacetylase ChbG (UPF0249 family)
VSPQLRQVGEAEIVDELRVIVSDETGATAYFTFSAQARPSLNQFRVYGAENGLFLDETQQSVIKLRGARFKSYAERFIPQAIFSRQYLRSLLHNLRLFLSHDFHMESGKKCLAESFYRSIIENTPVPIPYKQILLTSRIMEQIFEQIPAAGQKLEEKRTPDELSTYPETEINGHRWPELAVCASAIPAEAEVPVPLLTASRVSMVPPAKPRSVSGRNGAPPSLGSGLIVNADDWGRSPLETDAARFCSERDRISSVSAMVFMADSERAAELAQAGGMDVGLHLNLSEPFTGVDVPESIARDQMRICRFLNLNRYSLILYHPLLGGAFRRVYRAQLDEFLRLYGTPPSHVDGHLHKHLCTNMLLDEVIPRGQKVRRSFSFALRERGRLNLAYRGMINRWLARRYIVADYFFSLHYCLEHRILDRVIALAKMANVELATHPKNPWESDYLCGEQFARDFHGVSLLGYAQLNGPGSVNCSKMEDSTSTSEFHGA